MSASCSPLSLICQPDTWGHWASHYHQHRHHHYHVFSSSKVSDSSMGRASDRKAKLTWVRFPGFLQKSSFNADSSTVLVRQTLCASIIGGSDKHIFVATNTCLCVSVCDTRQRLWNPKRLAAIPSIVSTRQHCAHWQEWVALLLRLL